MVTVLVAAQDESLREAVSAALSPRGHEAVAVRDGAAARRALLSVRADALVLSTDLGLPYLQELMELVEEEQPSVPVLFLATLEERWSPGAVPRRQGVDGVMVRPCTGHQVVQELSRLLQRSEGDLLPIGTAYLHRPSRELRGSSGSVMLTATEAALLEYLARRRGQVVPVDELLAKVWGFPQGEGPAGTVRAHIRNLRTKLRMASGGEVRIRTVHRHGYLLD
ncbi:MAG TPA: response regulator transcription factor [Dehalococcoidia bacterium]|nr:response regulator transcription factor [Dehalococcoidia bacterium]